ncbi:MAG: hypothetical protein ACOYU7_09310 [Bacillota bacterium]
MFEFALLPSGLPDGRNNWIGLFAFLLGALLLYFVILSRDSRRRL